VPSGEQAELKAIVNSTRSEIVVDSALGASAKNPLKWPQLFDFRAALANKPGEYAAVLERLARRNVYAITSFIFGMDNDTPRVAERTLQEIRTWPPGLPIFGLLTPLPATPLYKRLEAAGRLTRPKHWQEFIPFEMAHTPLKMTIAQAHAEVKYGWASSYSPGGHGTGGRFASS
jgi:hypothetical protein